MLRSQACSNDAGMHRFALEDFQTLTRHAISSDDSERWSRLIGVLGGQDVWQRLTSLHCCLIGTGRTGSLVAAPLAKHGARALSLIDPDVLELHNLDAMDVVTTQDLGRLKAEAIAEHLQPDFPHMHISVLSQSVMTPEARSLLKAADVLICCMDDAPARLVTEAARRGQPDTV